MSFHETLNLIMDENNISAQALGTASGLSAATISRYRSGQRTPGRNGRELFALLDALDSLLSEKSAIEARSALMESLPDIGIDSSEFAKRLRTLLDSVPISRVKLASDIGYDPSFLSRVISGERVPADYISFAKAISSAIVVKYDKDDVRRAVIGLLKFDINQYYESSIISGYIVDYLISSDENMHSNLSEDKISNESAVMESFLSKLDAFDLNDYMKRIHFDKLRVPQSPIKSTGTKNYAGIDGMKKAELEFIKRTVLSSTSAPVYEFSSLPMALLAEDDDFAKKWMVGLALILKKGLQLNMIHDLDRPFPEMLLGLESWIPLYMTGLVNSFYLENPETPPYSHLIRTSEVCALTGECVNKDLSTAHFVLTSDKSQLPAMEQYRDIWFDKAIPLIEVYGDNLLDEYRKLCEKERSSDTPPRL